MTVTTKAPFRVLCDGMKGENYWIHGCAAYIASCLGLPREYNYQLFNCYAGDSVEQIFSKDPYKKVWHMSSSLPDESLKRIFQAMGRSYTRVTGINDENMDEWMPKVRESIEKGLPVMAKNGIEEPWIEYNCIVGCSDDGLLELLCDQDSPVTIEKYEFTELVFVGEKISTPIPVGEAYREAVFRIPELLERPEADGLSFGIQAFTDWAKQLSDGSLADYDNQWHNVWSVHGTYLCMFGSNGRGFGIFEKARQYNPDLDWLDEVEPMYNRLAEIFEILAYRDGGICGGFDMKPEDVRIPEKMKPVAEKIMEAAELTKKIAEKIKKHKINL